MADLNGDRRPDIEGPVENLFLTGHWTRPGGGITPVIISAVRAAEAVVRKLPAIRPRDGLGAAIEFPDEESSDFLEALAS